MKTCNRLHLEDIERGDRLKFSREESDIQTSRWKSPLEFNITVRYVVLDSRHGPRIIATEDVRYINEFDEEDSEYEFFLEDGWRVSAVKD